MKRGLQAERNMSETVLTLSQLAVSAVNPLLLSPPQYYSIIGSHLSILELTSIAAVLVANDALKKVKTLFF
jgi:hypothetical protein